MTSPLSGHAHLDGKGKIIVEEAAGVPFLASILATVGNIDFKTQGQTTLFTVPAGNNLFISDVIVKIDAAISVVAAPIIRIGKAANYNEWCALTTLTGLAAPGQYVNLVNAGNLLLRNVFVGNDVVKIDVATGANATTLTGTVYLIGMVG